MKSKPNSIGLVLILLAGVFWGSMGLFVRRLQALGFDPVQITAVRLRFAAIGFCAILLLRNPKSFLIRPKDIPLFLGLGLGSGLGIPARRRRLGVGIVLPALAASRERDGEQDKGEEEAERSLHRFSVHIRMETPLSGLLIQHYSKDLFHLCEYL